MVNKETKMVPLKRECLKSHKIYQIFFGVEIISAIYITIKRGLVKLCCLCQYGKPVPVLLI